MTERLRFYLDENIPVEVARQLRARSIETATVRELGLLGESDERHITLASEQGYFLCTHDADFLRLHSASVEHCGIVFGQQSLHYIGDWVNGLALLHAVYRPNDMINRIEYI